MKVKSFLIIIPVLAITAVGVYAFIQYIRFDPNSIQFATASIKVYDKNSTLLWEVSKDNAVKTTPIKIKNVPSNCVNGIIAVEDRYFWNNIGVDLNGIGRLGISIFSGEFAGGGSTITQQLIKVANERIYSRNPVDKLNEIVTAIKLNMALSKSEILEMYLNNVFFGDLNYGIESASQDYFKKSAKDLNLAQCSYLAGIPQWPGVLNPYGNQALAKERQKVVLEAMVRDGYISHEESDTAFNEDLAFNLTPPEVKAPHFVQFLSDLILKKITSTPNFHTINDLELGKSAEIYSTYDYELHKKALEISQNTINSLKERSVNNASIVILDKSNNLLTMIGSTNYFDDSINGKFNSALGFRQPGTSIMPYIYSYAFSKDKTPETSYSNLSFTTPIYRGDKQEIIEIKNFDDYQSPTETLFNALTQRYVIPSVELTSKIGEEKVSAAFNEFDILNIENRPKCSIASVVEGCEKDLLDMTYFYSVLKNNGLIIPINTINSVRRFDEDGKLLTQAPSTESNIKIGMEIVNSILSLNSSGWKVYNGDTSNFKDTFTFGFNENFTIGVWTGNTKGDPSSNVKASESSEVIFNQLSEYLNSLK
ncbi:MAG: transglycosylase domain-containing protein [Candidatus Dojkabacteria bacterium]